MRALLLALLLGIPLAAAGTMSAPDIPDGRDVEHAGADIVGVWFEPTSLGLRVNVQVASLPNAVADHLFIVLFTIDGERHAPRIGFDGSGRLLVDSTTYGGARANGDPEAASFAAGTPATLRMVLPWGTYDGLQVGATMSGLEAYSSYHPGGSAEWRADYDHANGRSVRIAAARTVAEAPATDGAELVPWVPAVILVACGAGGACAGWQLAARQRRGRS